MGLTDLASLRVPEGLRLRLETEADRPFLARLYASTREEEMRPVPWSEAEKAAFLQWQFGAQHQHYREHYPDCAFLVIERLGAADAGAGDAGAGDAGAGKAPRGAAEPIGRLYLDEWDEELRLVDVALVPEARGHGVGGALLRAILDHGRGLGKAVSIHVESNNPALRLYRRLGFRHVDSNGVYYLMRWEPEGAGETGSRQPPP